MEMLLVNMRITLSHKDVLNNEEQRILLKMLFVVKFPHVQMRTGTAHIMLNQ